VVKTILCDDCVRSESEHTWRAMVQVSSSSSGGGGG